ncbi:MAG: FMN adenylyltransferase [Rikenellaceae bacterium]|nr:FMN adenylyltransferase [Rikenellaceae bacterium]
MQIEGVVIRGHQLGRTLGFPTANIAVSTALAVADGVYRSRVWLDGVCYDAMSNLGCNPSVGGSERRLETHIFGYDSELYGRCMRVELLEKIREERKFASVDELREQILRDKASVLARIESQIVDAENK